MKEYITKNEHFVIGQKNLKEIIFDLQHMVQIMTHEIIGQQFLLAEALVKEGRYSEAIRRIVTVYMMMKNKKSVLL